MLNKIIIENFKGITFLEMDFGRKNLISGKNGVGKSTLEDAFLWCLTGEDKKGRQNYRVRNTHKPELDPVITLEFTKIKFRRSFKKTATGGNITIYEVDRGLGYDVVSLSDSNEKGEIRKGYKAYVNDLFHEFRLCSDIFFLAEGMEKDEARQFVLKHGGKPSDEELLSELNLNDREIVGNLLESYGANEAFSILKKTLSENKKLLKENTGELKAYEKAIFETTPKNSKLELRGNLEKSSKKIKELEEELKNIEVNSDLREIIIIAKNEKAQAEQKNHEENQKAFRVYELECERLKNEYKAEVNKEDDRFFIANRSYTQKVAEIKAKLFKKAKISELETKKIHFENELEKAKSEEFPVQPFENYIFEPKIFEQHENCDKCGQKLPVELFKSYKKKFDEEEEKRKQEFYASEKRRREIYDEQQNLSKNTFDKLIERNIKDINKKIDEIDAEISEILKTDFEALERELVDLPKPEKVEILPPKYPQQPTPKLFNFAEYDEKIRYAEIAFYESEGATEERRKPIKDKIANQVILRDLINEELGKWESVEKTKILYKKAEIEGKDIIKHNDEIERKLAALREYNKILAEKVRVKTLDFFGAEIELFKVQVDGELKPDCIVLCPCEGGSVPFDVANTGSRIKTGAKIVEKMQKMFNSFPPVFIDNSEAVTEFDDYDFQTIFLKVSKGELKNEH